MQPLAKKQVKPICAKVCRQIVRWRHRSTMNAVSIVKSTKNTSRGFAAAFPLQRGSMMKEGHASPRLISRANVCVDDQTAQHSTQQSSCERSSPRVEKGCVERKEAQGKRVASQDLKKGARAAIGKKRVDGQKCSRVSLLLGRASSSNRTNGWQS